MNAIDSLQWAIFECSGGCTRKQIAQAKLDASETRAEELLQAIAELLVFSVGGGSTDVCSLGPPICEQALTLHLEVIVVGRRTLESLSEFVYPSALRIAPR